MVEEKNNKLEVGDKYLSISIKASDILALSLKAVLDGEKYINLAGFKNKDKLEDKHPDYKGGSGLVSIWIKKKEDKSGV